MDNCQALLQQAAAVPEEPQPKKRTASKSLWNMGKLWEIHGRLSVFCWFHMFHGIVMGYVFFTSCMV
jgi:hypothetical protein